MNGMTVYGGSMSTGVALMGSTIGLGFLSQTSASSLSNLSSALPPSTDTKPTISKLSDSESTQIPDAPVLTTDTPKYTQKQLESAEKLGADLEECQLIQNKKNMSTDYLVQNPKTSSTSDNAFSKNLNKVIARFKVGWFTTLYTVLMFTLVSGILLKDKSKQPTSKTHITK